MLPVVSSCDNDSQPLALSLKKSNRNAPHWLLAYGQQPIMIHYFGKCIRDRNVLFRCFVLFSNMRGHVSQDFT
jgi:hypothetical protein